MYVHKKAFIRKITAALFLTDPNWKQSNCSLTGEWVKESWHIYRMENYLAFKKKKEQTDEAWSMDKSPKHYAGWKARHKK